MLTAITEAGRVREGYARLVSAWTRGARALRRRVGWPGGGGEFDILWRPQERVWGLFSEDQTENRYWCCYGLTDPTDRPMVGITVEINPPLQGIHRKIAGVFSVDRNGTIYLTHSGRLGGGAKGITKQGFLQSYRGRNTAEVEWPDGKATAAILIGRVDGRHLPLQIATFAREVGRYKALVKSGVSMPGDVLPDFTPEFVGRRSYDVAARVEALCDHGVVVAGLAKLLEDRGLAVGNDRHCDLFVWQGEGLMSHLFEVKTDDTLTSIYQGVGQLMVHGARQSTVPRRILVLPSLPEVEWIDRLSRAGISILRYSWEEAGPVFFNSQEACFGSLPST